MKHDILGLLIFLLVSIPVGMHAQKSQSSYSVKGVLVDSLSNEGEPYATIRISLSESPTKPVRLAVTSDNGKFNEKLNLPGRYIISFSSVGKNTVIFGGTTAADYDNAYLPSGKTLIKAGE